MLKCLAKKYSWCICGFSIMGCNWRFVMTIFTRLVLNSLSPQFRLVVVLAPWMLPLILSQSFLFVSVIPQASFGTISSPSHSLNLQIWKHYKGELNLVLVHNGKSSQNQLSNMRFPTPFERFWGIFVPISVGGIFPILNPRLFHAKMEEFLSF